MGKLSTKPSRTRVHVRDLMVMGVYNTCTDKSLRSRGRAREDFYAPVIAYDVDAAVDYGMSATHGDPKYRRAWCFYCLRLGINTFLDQLDAVLSCARQGEIHEPARAFHARLRHIKDQLDKQGGLK